MLFFVDQSYILNCCYSKCRALADEISCFHSFRCGIRMTKAVFHTAPAHVFNLVSSLLWRSIQRIQSISWYHLQVVTSTCRCWPFQYLSQVHSDSLSSILGGEQRSSKPATFFRMCSLPCTCSCRCYAGLDSFRRVLTKSTWPCL